MKSLWFALTQYMRFLFMGESPRVAWGLAVWHYDMAETYSNWIELGKGG